MNMSKGGRNRALSVLSSLFIHAEIRGLRPPGSNPCAGMRRHDMRFKARYLDADEYAALGRAFAKASVTSPMAVRIFRFCALTGCRKSEALMLRWSMIDGNRAALPDSKSGPKSIWLSRPVRKLIATVPKTGDLVFEIDGEPVCPRMLQRVWDDIRSDLGIPTFRIHDLRHCFASVAVSLGYDLLIVGGLLGHADKGSTAGYAHLSTRDVAAASARVGKHFAKVIAGQQPGKAYKPRRRGSKPDKLIGAFLRSKDTLTAFCASRGLEPETFRREVENWRSVNARLAP
jgi:integrase